MKNHNLIFPSGRHIDRVRKDAARLKKQLGIGHTEALNQLTIDNGLEMPWHEAVEFLKNGIKYSNILDRAFMPSLKSKTIITAEEFASGHLGSHISVNGSNGEQLKVTGAIKRILKYLLKVYDLRRELRFTIFIGDGNTLPKSKIFPLSRPIHRKQIAAFEEGFLNLTEACVDGNTTLKEDVHRFSRPVFSVINKTQVSSACFTIDITMDIYSINICRWLLMDTKNRYYK